MQVGTELRQARERAGLSAEQIAERTKIQVHRIEALENEQRALAEKIASKMPETVQRWAERTEEYMRGWVTGGTLFEELGFYYVGPVDPVRDEVVGPAGPTTATRMDKFTEQVLSQTGLLGMIGKAERGPVAIEAIRRHRSAYLMAVGGAAYLVSKAIKSARVVAFADLGMEAIYEFTVQDMPVTVAVDSNGESVHLTGPKEWQARIGQIPVVVA